MKRQRALVALAALVALPTSTQAEEPRRWMGLPDIGTCSVGPPETDEPRELLFERCTVVEIDPDLGEITDPEDCLRLVSEKGRWEVTLRGHAISGRYVSRPEVLVGDTASDHLIVGNLGHGSIEIVRFGQAFGPYDSDTLINTSQGKVIASLTERSFALLLHEGGKTSVIVNGQAVGTIPAGAEMIEMRFDNRLARLEISYWLDLEKQKRRFNVPQTTTWTILR